MAQHSYISYFDAAINNIPDSKFTNAEYLQYVISGRWKKQVDEYRAGKIEKKFLPIITASGLFSKRNSNNLIAASGRIVADVDTKSNSSVDMNQLFTQLKKDPTVEWIHTSVGGEGLAVCHLIPKSAKRFTGCFLALESYYLNTYATIIDPACKDITRARFVGFDPDAYFNSKAIPFQQCIEDVDNPEKSSIKIDLSNNEIDVIIKRIMVEEVDITGDYELWVKLCFSLIAKFKADARVRFHAISKFYAKYNEIQADKQFDQCLAHYNNTRDLSVSIKTFLFFAKSAGISIINESLCELKSIAALFRKFGRPKETLFDMRNDDESKEAIEEVYNLSTADLNNIIKYTRRVDILKIIIHHLYKVTYNEVTGELFVDNEAITDAFQHNVRMDLMDLLGMKFPDGDLLMAFKSMEIHARFNPFLVYIKEHETLPVDANYFKEVADCFNSSSMTPETIEKFFRSWYLGMISSIHGTHSILVLILSGRQGIGKTNFFRDLLPEDLKPYFATKGIDKDDKDDLRLMTEKLIILDDEFAGKSRREVKDFKELVSKDEITFRLPYARHSTKKKRLCVFAGTTNTSDIIEDFTGNRRIIPIMVDEFDANRYAQIDKNKLFMQAYREWKSTGEKWMLDRSDIDHLRDVSTQFIVTLEEEVLLDKYIEPVTELEADFLATPSDLLGYLQSKTRTRLSAKRLHTMLNIKGYQPGMKSVRGKKGRFVCVKFVNKADFQEYLMSIGDLSMKPNSNSTEEPPPSF